MKAPAMHHHRTLSLTASALLLVACGDDGGTADSTTDVATTEAGTTAATGDAPSTGDVPTTTDGPDGTTADDDTTAAGTTGEPVANLAHAQ